MKHPINTESITQLVEEFYTAIRQDAILGPVFENLIQDNWAQHLDRMVAFWSTVMLGNKNFQGNVYGKHMALTGIEPEHFARWLYHFEQTTERLFQVEQATQFNLVAHRIGNSLQLGFFDKIIVP